MCHFYVHLYPNAGLNLSIFANPVIDLVRYFITGLASVDRIIEII